MRSRNKNEGKNFNHKDGFPIRFFPLFFFFFLQSSEEEKLKQTNLKDLHFDVQIVFINLFLIAVTVTMSTSFLS